MADHRGTTTYHFSGIAGQGTSPLARLMRAWGHEVQGSDRAFDQGKQRDLAATLTALGIRLLPQDGTAVTPGLDRFVFSTAVEAETPELRAARALGVERVPRPALLAEVVNGGGPGVAVSGTSGKSTVTGMIAWILRDAGIPATVLGGAALVGEGVIGCFAAGPDGGPVVAEACESDGTLVGYRPGIGLILNVSRDHAEMDSLRTQFSTFARQCRTLFINATSAEACAIGAEVGARTFGVMPDADARLGKHQPLDRVAELLRTDGDPGAGRPDFHGAGRRAGAQGGDDQPDSGDEVFSQREPGRPAVRIERRDQRPARDRRRRPRCQVQQRPGRGAAHDVRALHAGPRGQQHDPGADGRRSRGADQQRARSRAAGRSKPAYGRRLDAARADRAPLPAASSPSTAA